jgi:hypothetical protein
LVYTGGKQCENPWATRVKIHSVEWPRFPASLTIPNADGQGRRTVPNSCEVRSEPVQLLGEDFWTGSQIFVIEDLWINGFSSNLPAALSLKCPLVKNIEDLPQFSPNNKDNWPGFFCLGAGSYVLSTDKKGLQQPTLKPGKFPEA